MGQVTSRARLKVRLSYCLSGCVSYMYLMVSKENIKGHPVTPILKWENLNIVQFWTLSKGSSGHLSFHSKTTDIFSCPPLSFFYFFKGKICGPSCWMQNFEATFAHILKLLLLIIIYYLSPLCPGLFNKYYL